MAKWRILFHDIGLGNFLRFEKCPENFIGRARIDIIGAEQDETFSTAAVLGHQVFHGRNRLLIWRGAGVEYILRQFLAFILHRIKEQAVQFFEYRQHAFTRYRGPTAKNNGDLILSEQLARLLRKQRPVGSGIHDYGFQFFAKNPAFCIDLFHRH